MVKLCTQNPIHQCFPQFKINECMLCIVLSHENESEGLHDINHEAPAERLYQVYTLVFHIYSVFHIYVPRGKCPFNYCLS